ncbi:hypothetical protein EDD16DRAFT_1484951, partial [Pisolithus croceorrhizus]
VYDKKPLKVKTFGIWPCYDSCLCTQNMQKRFRELSRADAVESIYQDMVAINRTRFRSVRVCVPRSDEPPQPLTRHGLSYGPAYVDSSYR